MTTVFKLADKVAAFKGQTGVVGMACKQRHFGHVLCISGDFGQT